MKAGWELKAIGDFCSLATGGTPKRSEKENFEGGEIRWLVSGDIHRKYIEDCEGRITKKGLQSSNAKFLPLNSVMIALNGQGKTRGTVALLKIAATCNQSLVSIMPKDTSKVLPEYLFINLYGRYEEIRRITGDSGNDRRGLNMHLIRAISVPIPPLEEQSRIVAVLDEALAALDRARENVEANLEDAVALSATAISNAFEAIHGNGEPLNELADFENGDRGANYLGKKLFQESGVPVISAKHISDGVIDWANVNYVSREAFEKTERGHISKGDILFCLRGSLGKFGVVDKDIDGAIASSLVIIRPREKLDKEYLTHYLRSSICQKEIEKRAGGAAQPNLGAQDLAKFSVPVPPLAQQKIISKRLDQIVNICDLARRNHSAQLADVADLRQSLLERAFAGELTQASPSLAINDNKREERFSAAILVLAYEKHRLEERHKTFGTVKAQKTLHLTESVGGLDLGRQPKVRQAGPHDQEHFDRVETWAEQNDIFRFEQRRTGKRGYDFIRGKKYASFLNEAKTLLADYQAGLSRFLPLMTQMNTEEAEIFTTVHAAWSNLLIDGKTPSDEDIVWAAREGWHESKLDIERTKFFDAIREIRRHDLEPDGSAKYVHGAQVSLL